MKKESNPLPDILVASSDSDAVDVSRTERNTQQEGEGLPDDDRLGLQCGHQVYHGQTEPWEAATASMTV